MQRRKRIRLAVMLTAAILGAISLALYLINSIGIEIHRCPNYAPEGIHENLDIKSELSLFQTANIFKSHQMVTRFY